MTIIVDNGKEIEIIHGLPYAFVHNSVDMMGIFDEHYYVFMIGGLGEVQLENCKHIRPITIQGE